VKHKFLLDENILHFAINGMDEHNQKDDTSTILVQQIGANCHKILVNRFMLDRYWRQITTIIRDGRRPRALEPIAFINQLLNNSLKWFVDARDLPDLPEDARIPAEDVDIVKFAMLTQAVVISGDSDLREGINGCPAMGIRAVSQKQALPFVAEV
jgi:hypothetical protein